MATIEGRPTMQLNVTLALTEPEARALDALVGYGVDPFLKAFYEKMGRAYLEPHESGLRTLFESVRQTVPGILNRAKEANQVFRGVATAVPLPRE
jgi:hypothetical protein